MAAENVTIPHFPQIRLPQISFPHPQIKRMLDLGHGVAAKEKKRLLHQSSPEQQSRKSLSSTGRSERAASSGESSATDTAQSLSNTPQTEPLTRRRSIAKPSPFGKVCVAATREIKNRENYSHTRHFQQSQQRLLKEPRCLPEEQCERKLAKRTNCQFLLIVNCLLSTSAL